MRSLCWLTRQFSDVFVQFAVSLKRTCQDRNMGIANAGASSEAGIQPVKCQNAHLPG